MPFRQLPVVPPAPLVPLPFLFERTRPRPRRFPLYPGFENCNYPRCITVTFIIFRNAREGSQKQNGGEKEGKREELRLTLESLLNYRVARWSPAA